MKRISPAALNSLRDALAPIYWYKSDLRGFVTTCLPDAAIPATINWQANKRDTVNHLVDHLAKRQSEHLPATLRLMLEVARLEDFSHLKILDDGEQKAELAHAAVAALKKHVAGHIELVEEQLKSNERREQARERRLNNQATQARLGELREDYVEFVGMSEQKRGYALEDLMNGLFDLFDLDPKRSFRIEGEQIDGAFSFEGTDYLLEARWRRKPTSREALDAFHSKISRKLENTLGLFLSISGFGDQAVGAYSNHGSRMILMDGADLMAVLEDRVTLDRLLLLKRRRASQKGEVYVPFDQLLN
jgi:hypothetical protein